jgi:hypothetical protein rflaF_07567
MTDSHLRRRDIMASESVKKILEAEAESDRKISEAHRRSSEIISEAERNSSLAIQNKLSEASSKVSGLKAGYDEKIKEYTAEAETECKRKISDIKAKAEKNTDNAVEMIIKEFF